MNNIINLGIGGLMVAIGVLFGIGYICHDDLSSQRARGMGIAAAALMILGFLCALPSLIESFL